MIDARASGGQLRAGVARRDITQPPGSPAGLSLTMPVDEIWDPLTATVLVLEAGQLRTALVGLDLVGVLATTHARIRSAVSRATGVPPEHVIVNASHTHSAPYVSEELQALLRPHGLRIMADTFADELVGAIEAAAVEAAGRAQPVTARFARGAVDRIASNRRPRLPDGGIVHRFGRPSAWMRRLPEGHIDPEVAVLTLDGLFGTVATLASYACHPTAAGGDNHPHVSADFVGVGRAVVEDAVGAPVLFLQGCGGDVGTGKWVARGRRADAAAMGRRFSLDAPAPRGTHRPRGRGADARRMPEQEAELEAAVRASDAARIVATGDAIVVARRAEQARRPLVKSVAIGDVALVALPGEVFLELGQSIARRSPFATTVVTAYDDNTLQYIPTAAAFDDGAYEIAGGWRYVSRGQGERLADQAVALVQAMASASR
ncbi:MAG: hypothetical protein E6I94_09960 [Chloroflexi bacterium]|nr:MAG: hypothetical protein E6I94_09960 [Chloroflexota bacterium]